LLYIFVGHTGGISSVAMSGDKVVAGSWDGTAKVWSLLPKLQGTTQSNPLVWIIHNSDMLQLDLIKRAYEATVAGEEFILNSKDLKTFSELLMHVKRYLLNRLKINIKK